MKNKNIKKVIKYIFELILLLVVLISLYIKYTFKSVPFEQIVYSLMTSKGTSFSSISKGLLFVVISGVIAISIYLVILKISQKFKGKVFVNITIKDKKSQLDAIDYIGKIIFTLYIIFSILLPVKILKIDEFIKYQNQYSKIYDEFYIDPRNVNITFPEKKKNLIYIYVESLESTFASKANGGALEESIIPNLESIALNNLNFSNRENLGGGYEVSGATYTAGALIAQTSGVPLKVSVDVNADLSYDNSIKGLYTLGDILLDNGYKNYFMIGSDAAFGCRDDYFSYHGKYEIYDYEYARKNKLISKNYKVWWGYEDKKLFAFAKDKLLEISKSDEPFNFTLLTADTHFPDGYLDSSCEKKFKDNYSNSFSCMDSMIYEFINWIKEQDFYKDTVIIITGDHFTMQETFLDSIDSGYNRSVYNAFINTDKVPVNSKNRVFTTLDMFPTTLSALGVSIENDRLGLGTDLFSSSETLAEELGYDAFNNELMKKSAFYEKYFINNAY